MIQPANGKKADLLSFGPFSVDREGGILLRDGQDVRVPPKAMGVLLCLLERPGALVGKEDLLETVWNGTTVSDGSLTEAVRTLRSALGDDPQQPTYVQTVHRRGYRFIAEVHVEADEPPVAVTTAPTAAETSPSPTTSAAGRDTGPSGVLEPQTGTEAATLGLPRPTWSSPLALVGAFGLGILVMVLGFSLLPREAPPVPVEAFNFGPPSGSVFFPQSHTVAVKQDGSSIVVGVTAMNDGQRLSLRPIDSLEQQPLLGSVGRWVTYVAFSPDGDRLVYLSGTGDGIESIDLAGGPHRALCSDCVFPEGRFAGLTFAPDGTVFFAFGPPLDSDGGVPDTAALWRMPASGGEPELALDKEAMQEGVDYLWPRFLPGGQWMLVTLRQGHNVEHARIAALDVTTGEHRHLIENGFNARYVASGHLVFGRDGDLWAVAFDPGKVELVGDPAEIPLEKQVAMSAENGSAGFDVSETGVFAYLPGVFESRDYGIVSVDQSGGKARLVEGRGDFSDARLSPDNTRIAVCVRKNRDQIHVYNLRSSEVDFVIENPAHDLCNPVWSPSGTRLAFSWDRTDLYTIPARHDGERRLLVTSDRHIEPVDWSPDGQIAYNAAREVGGFDIWTVDADCGRNQRIPCGSEHRRPFLATERDEVAGRLSPDGNWLTTRLGPAWTAHVVAFPDPGPPIEVAGSNNPPMWSADGTALYFGSRRASWNDGAPIDPSSVQRYDLPKRVTPVDIFRDGSGVVGIDKSAERVPTEEVVVITNWFEVLRRIAPPTR